MVRLYGKLFPAKFIVNIVLYVNLCNLNAVPFFTSIPRFTLCTIGVGLVISSLVVLSCINQDDARHSFGHTGGTLSFLLKGFFPCFCSGFPCQHPNGQNLNNTCYRIVFYTYGSCSYFFSGFICPLIPLLPVASILINMYLLVNLG